MSSPLTISIILCSCNRAAGLRQTLEALGRVRIRPDWEAEVIVVDNASTDETASVAQNTKLANMDVKYLFEGRKGKGHALNAGLGNARAAKFFSSPTMTFSFRKTGSRRWWRRSTTKNATR